VTVWSACKIVERNRLELVQEQMIVNEIHTHNLISSKHIIKLKKAIKTDQQYFMFMEYCNGGNLRELMDIKKWVLDPMVI